MELSNSLQHNSPCPLLHSPSLITSKRRSITGVLATAMRDNSGGRQVDRNMIVLRKRIHEMKMAETNEQPPVHWTHWEKQWFGDYDSLICELIGLLQSELMNTRPAVALGIIAFVALGVFVSTTMVAFHLLDMAHSLFAHTNY